MKVLGQPFLNVQSAYKRQNTGVGKSHFLHFLEVARQDALTKWRPNHVPHCLRDCRTFYKVFAVRVRQARRMPLTFTFLLFFAVLCGISFIFSPILGLSKRHPSDSQAGSCLKVSAVLAVCLSPDHPAFDRLPAGLPSSSPSEDLLAQAKVIDTPACIYHGTRSL